MVCLLSPGPCSCSGRDLPHPRRLLQWTTPGRRKRAPRLPDRPVPDSRARHHESTGNEKAKVLAEALDAAIATYLDKDRLPSRKVNEIDNRGSTFHLALYRAQARAAQDRDAIIGGMG